MVNFRQQLEASIRDMKYGRFTDATELSETGNKAETSSTSVDIMAAHEWMIKLFQDLAAISDDETKGTSVFKEFKDIESLVYNEFLTFRLNKTKDWFEEIISVRNDPEHPHERRELAFVYVPKLIRNEEYLAVKEYENVGTYLTSETSEPVEEMTKLTESIYEEMHNSSSRTVPSFFVCSSAGTGKTQLPFSLKIPLLYFCCEFTANAQPLYELYRNISEHFMKLLNDDFLEYIEAFKSNIENILELQERLKEQNKNNSSFQQTSDLRENFIKNYDVRYTLKNISRHIPGYALNYFTVERLETAPCKFRSISFLIQLIEKIRTLQRSDGRNDQIYSEMNWPRLQLSMMDGFIIIPKKLSISESKEILYKMLSDMPTSDPKFCLPLVFLDEFNVNQETNMKSRIRYAFYRDILRASGLIPVMMGSNPQMVDIITFGIAGNKEPTIWAHIFYKLPEYPKKLFEENIENIEGLSVSCRETLKTIYPLLQQDRPLFVQSIFKDDKKLKNPGVITNSIVPWLEFIISKFRLTFSQLKFDNIEYFYSHQNRLFMNSYARSLNEGENPLPPVLIHSYLGYLIPPYQNYPKCDKSYFDLYLTHKKIQYKRKNEEKIYYWNYKADSRLPTFDTEPFTCMAFSQNNSEDFCSFMKYSDYFTTFQAATECLQKFNQRQCRLGIWGGLNISSLDQLVSTAFMISSHTNLLTGMAFKEWFAFFIQQLACYDLNNFEGAKPITFDSSFKLGDYKVPYFAFDSANWPVGFVDLLKNDACFLGTYSGAFRESRNLSASSDLYQYNIDLDDKKEESSYSKQDFDKDSESEQDSDKDSDDVWNFECDNDSECEQDSKKDSESEKDFSVVETLDEEQCVTDKEGGIEISSQIELDQIISNESVEINFPESIKMCEKESITERMFSIKCKLDEEEQSCLQIKEIIMKMMSADFQSKFNFIVAQKISSQIEFTYEPNYFGKIIKIRQLKNQLQWLKLTKSVDRSKLQIPSTMRGKSISKRKLSMERNQLKKELEGEIPFNDISIFRLVRRPSKCPIETKKYYSSDCQYTFPQFELHLIPVYNCDVETSIIFILIDLEEIHGADHLKDCIMYFRYNL